MENQEEFQLEWEERDESVPFGVHMIAGSFAGLMEHILLLPLDNIKTHMQTSSSSFSSAFREIRSGGLMNFYAGSRVVAVGCVPSHALFFLNYEFWKKQFGTQDEPNLFKNMGLGASSALFHDLIMTPCDMIKQRMQLSNLGYTTIVKESFRKEGISTFWRSFPVNFVSNLPAATITVAANENLRFVYKKFVGDLKVHSHFICASVAGMISACLTTPLDNIRTRLNTQLFHVENRSKIKSIDPHFSASPSNSRQTFSKVQKAFSQHNHPHAGACPCNPLSPSNGSQTKPVKYPDALCAVKIILKEEGLRGFFKGVSPRVANQSLSAGLSWTIYEAAKSFLIARKSAF